MASASGNPPGCLLWLSEQSLSNFSGRSFADQMVALVSPNPGSSVITTARSAIRRSNSTCANIMCRNACVKGAISELSGSGKKRTEATRCCVGSWGHGRRRDTIVSGWTWRALQASNPTHEDAPYDHHARRPTPRDAVALVELRALPTSRAAGVRGRCYPLGPRCVEQRPAGARALHALRPQRRDAPTSRLGRGERRLHAISGALTLLEAGFITLALGRNEADRSGVPYRPVRQSL